MQCTNFIGSVTDQRLRSLNAKASAIAQATTNGADDQETICATDTHNNDYTSFQFDLISSITSSNDANNDLTISVITPGSSAATT